MARLPTPITVEGSAMCCQPSLHGITPSVVIGVSSGEEDASAMFGGPPGQGIWYSTNGGAGGFSFGICCATEITLRFRGNLRMLESGKDEITAYLNGGAVWTAASDTAAADAYRDYFNGGSHTSDALGYPYYEGTPGDPDYQEYHDMTISLTSPACGDVLKFLCGYADSYPVNPVTEVAVAFWRVQILHLPPVIP